MNGRFLAEGAFFDARGLFVVHGQMLDGEPRIGQLAETKIGFRARVHGIEFIRLSGGKENLALTFLPTTKDDVVGWVALQLVGGEIALRDRIDRA